MNSNRMVGAVAASIVVLLIMVWVIDVLMSLVERRLFRWRPSGPLQSNS